MQKKPALGLTLLLGVLLVLVTACGSNTPFSSTSATATVPPGENIYVLDGYTQLGNTGTGQHIVAFHPGNANATALVSLPAGLTSMDHRKLYTATTQNGQTTIAVINTQTGSTIRTFAIPGTYSTAGQGYDTPALSSNGQWLALRQYLQTTGMTIIALVDTQAGKLVKTIDLGGEFDLDVVSPDGSRIYLLEKFNNNAGHYAVRLYDVNKNQLYPAPIVDKTIPNDIMSGSALTRQMASDGSLSYTLYIDTVHNIAFVHILPLSGDFIGARCIDLPVGRSADLLHYYTLALSSDGTTLYAANGALGVVRAISLNGDEVFYDKIAHSSHFDPGNISMSSSDKTRVLYNGAALSSDQKMLYFAGMYGVWAVNTADLNVQGHYLTQQALTGIALSADNRTLYAVDPANGITLLDAATGQPQQVVQGPVHNPWGIEWITN